MLRKMETLLSPAPVKSGKTDKNKRKRKREVNTLALDDIGLLGFLKDVTLASMNELSPSLSQYADLSYKVCMLCQKRRQEDRSSSVGDHFATLTTSISDLGLDDATSVVEVLKQKMPLHAPLNITGQTTSQESANEKLLSRIVTLESIAADQANIMLKLRIQNLQFSRDAKVQPITTVSVIAEDRLASWGQQNGMNIAKPPHKLSISTLPVHESALDPRVHKLFWKYQCKVHGEEYPMTASTSINNSDAQAKWALRAPKGWLAKAQDMLRNEYGHLSSERQCRIRRSFVSFYDFLIENPFSNVTSPFGHHEESSRGSLPTGAYHQHYEIGGHLLAVGVIDLLPTGFSSVYMCYDPIFARDLLPLGKYSTLREIEWTRDANLPYYYLGYYIESCQKMRYKAEYKKSEMLCPSSYTWVDAELAQAKLLKDSPNRHCCVLSTDETVASDDHEAAMCRIAIDIGQEETLTMEMLADSAQEIVRGALEEFVTQAGPETAQQCVLDCR